jgi:ketosteroid isomerase-like protein
MQTAPGNTELSGMIRAIAEEFRRNVKAKDADRLVSSFYAEDCQVLPPDRPLVKGRRAVLEFWQGLLNMGLSDIGLEPTEIDASGDLAYEIGQYTLEIHPPSGEPVRDDGKYLVVYRRQADGSLKAIADMFSSNHPAA